MSVGMTIFIKELRESLRDKRVVIGAFVVPIFLIVMLTRLTSALEKSVGREAKFELTIVGSQEHPLVQLLKSNKRAELDFAESPEVARSDLKKNKTSLVLQVFDSEGDQIKAKAFYDGERPLSLAAFSGLRQAVSEANTQALRQVLTAQGIDTSKAEAMKLDSEDVSKDQGVTGGAWSSLLPYLIILWSFYGGFSIVSDMVAGEKEKKTMETLLLAPAHRRSIVFGKFMALFVICLMSGLMSLVGLFISILIGGEGTTISLGPLSVLAFVLVLLPLVAFYAGILLSVSALAKSMRESQTYLTVVSFLVMIPAISSQFVGFTGADRTEWIKWTPILNTSITMSQALRDQVDWSIVGRSVLVSTILAAIFAVICIKVFERESILQRT